MGFASLNPSYALATDVAWEKVRTRHSPSHHTTTAAPVPTRHLALRHVRVGKARNAAWIIRAEPSALPNLPKREELAPCLSRKSNG
jgi:hypothetical protein